MKAARAMLGLVGLLAIGMALFAMSIWHARETLLVQSRHLGEDRRLILFNAPEDQTARVGKAIVVLDGERCRHGLSTAIQGRIAAWLAGRDAPLVVGVDTHGSRDKDLRNEKSEPAQWRPLRAGRADAFDRFLIDEAVTSLEERLSADGKLYLVGHSLGGLYALDFSTRHPAGKPFVGIGALVPTISHDRSVIERLPRLCKKGNEVLVTLGWESGRERDLFSRAERSVSAAPSCRAAPVAFERHHGWFHQISMISGQWRFLRRVIYR